MQLSRVILLDGSGFMNSIFSQDILPFEIAIHQHHRKQQETVLKKHIIQELQHRPTPIYQLTPTPHNERHNKSPQHQKNLSQHHAKLSKRKH